MDRIEALQHLGSATPDDRLRAARSLSRTCTEEDIPALRAALAAENNRWVKSALTRAIASVQRDPPSAHASSEAESDEEKILEQINAEAVEETTKRLVHELRPILGRLDVCAAAEIPEYKKSRTKVEWSRLKEFLSVIDQLSQAASPAIYVEFDLAASIEEVIAAERVDHVVPIESAGAKPMVILGASSYIQLILGNAVRNALEASKGMPLKEAIVVTWGSTDRDYFIAVLDRGCGLPAATQKIFEIGTTTKKDHLGMGLALARQAATSLNGKITLGPREPSGTRFEFRWPKVKT
jgi:signal transduction histidine kinase